MVQRYLSQARLKKNLYKLRKIWYNFPRCKAEGYRHLWMVVFEHSKALPKGWACLDGPKGALWLHSDGSFQSPDSRKALPVSLSKHSTNMVVSSHMTQPVPLVVLAKGDSTSNCSEKKPAVWLAHDTSYLDWEWLRNLYAWIWRITAAIRRCHNNPTKKLCMLKNALRLLYRAQPTLTNLLLICSFRWLSKHGQWSCACKTKTIKINFKKD